MTTQLETPKQVKARSKPARSLSIIEQRGETVVIGITVGKTTQHYVIDALDSDFGRAFRFTKPDGTSYAVNVNGADTLCDCRGHVNHCHCKHTSAVRKLQELTLLPVAMPFPPEPGSVEVWDDTTWD